MKALLWKIYSWIVIFWAGYFAFFMGVVGTKDPRGGIVFGVLFGLLLFGLIYTMFVWMPNKVYRRLFAKSDKLLEVSEYEIEDNTRETNLNSFEDLLKRGNLPDDDRVVPEWMKIKNEQFDDVDFSNNSVEQLAALSSDEFNELVSLLIKDESEGLLLTYVATLEEEELQKFYSYLESVKLDENTAATDARAQFEASMESIDIDKISDLSKARATLELPLGIRYAKVMYQKSMEFKEYIAKGYYNYDAEDEFKVIEGHLVKTLWGEMKYIPDHFEQVLDHFKKFYDENDAEHQKFAQHLAYRFGHLIGALDLLVQLTEEERKSSLSWFMEKFGLGKEPISGLEMYKLDELNFHLTNMFMGICEQNDDAYLSSLISCVECLFEYYPLHDEACHYAMEEMMKSVAMKKVNVENANRFIAFFETLPRFYEKMDYLRISKLKSIINHTLTNEKPQDNGIFDNPEVKNKLILLNYLVDMEDLYYESKDGELAKKKYTLFLAEYVKRFKTFKDESDLRSAELWGHPVTVDKTWDRFDGVIKNKSAGTIGWMPPVTADIFDMSVEIPVVFEKLNGEHLSVGVPLDLVELKR